MPLSSKSTTAPTSSAAPTPRTSSASPILVDTKMRAVAANGDTVDCLRVAVLAALNIADELMSLRAQHNSLVASLNQHQTSARTRAGWLTGMLDEVLLERGKPAKQITHR